MKIKTKIIRAFAQYRYLVLLFVIITSCSSSDNESEGNVSANLKFRSGDIETYIGTIIDSVPGSTGDHYNSPSFIELNIWSAIVTSINQNDIDNAVISAEQLDYQITEFTDTTLSPIQVFYILEKKATSNNHWGTYVFCKNPEIDNLVLMAPHIKNDVNTGKQAVYCFKNNLARVLMISGAHRCNSSQLSPCSGTTSVCSSEAPFRISDLAHNTESVFQKTTEVLLNSISNSVFIQLHGFAQQVGDPYVILSNGTRETPINDYVSLLKATLFEEDNTLTFKTAHIDLDWTRLIGFTNTQGRLINNSTDPCDTSATSTTGRFIHIEQERTKLRDNITGWTKMSNAIGNMF